MLRTSGLRLALALSVVAVGLAACGEDPLEPVISQADRARDARALSSVQQALVTAALVRTETVGTYGSGTNDLIARMRSRDPTKQYTAGASTGPDVIQVVGGGSAPLMLVAYSKAPAYLAAWQEGGAGTVYYRGEQPPQYTRQAPAGAGWSQTPPSP